MGSTTELTILPCQRVPGKCDAPCCKRGAHGWPVAVRLEPDEQFAHMHAVFDGAVPYRDDGRCVFLGADDRCTIYDERPRGCRHFNCAKDRQFQAAFPMVKALLGIT